MALECCLSGRSVDGFLDLPRQFRRDLTCKEHDECGILPVGQGAVGYKIDMAGLPSNYPLKSSLYGRVLWILSFY